MVTVERSTYVHFFHALRSIGESGWVKKLSFVLCTQRIQYCSVGKPGSCNTGLVADRNLCLSFFNPSNKCSLDRLNVALHKRIYVTMTPHLSKHDCLALPTGNKSLTWVRSIIGEKA